MEYRSKRPIEVEAFLGSKKRTKGSTVFAQWINEVANGILIARCATQFNEVYEKPGKALPGILHRQKKEKNKKENNEVKETKKRAERKFYFRSVSFHSIPNHIRDNLIYPLNVFAISRHLPAFLQEEPRLSIPIHYWRKLYQPTLFRYLLPVFRQFCNSPFHR